MRFESCSPMKESDLPSNLHCSVLALFTISRYSFERSNLPITVEDNITFYIKELAVLDYNADPESVVSYDVPFEPNVDHAGIEHFDTLFQPQSEPDFVHNIGQQQTIDEDDEEAVLL